MGERDDKFMLEQLKKIQDGVAEIRSGQTDLREDMRGLQRDVRDVQATTAKAFDTLNASTATVLGLLGELVKAEGLDRERFASIEARLSSLEQRMQEQERLPPH
jgi:hypothetical protein